MKKRFSPKLIFLSFIVSACFLIFCPASLTGQEVDPFYVSIFERAEKEFQAQNYKDAARQFEIAAFGLGGDPQLKTKSYIYLSLCHHHLGSLSEREKYINQAAELMDAEEFQNLGLPESEWLILQNILTRYGVISNPIDRARDLEMLVNEQPDNVALYYELYGVYIELDNRTAAKNTLEKLVDKHRDEFEGYYRLGIICFQERKFKEALKYFEKVSNPKNENTISENTEKGVRAYIILSTHLKGSKKKAYKLIEESIDELSENRIASLRIAERDKAALQNIIRNYHQEKK